MGRLEYPLMMTSDKKPCWWNCFFGRHPFCPEVTQRLISVLKQHPDEIGLSKCVLEATTIDKQLYAAVSLLPHDAAASPSCAKKNGWIHSNMTPQNDRCSDMRFSRKNALPKIRVMVHAPQKTSICTASAPPNFELPARHGNVHPPDLILTSFAKTTLPSLSAGFRNIHIWVRIKNRVWIAPR